eukprot:scaffold48855_cov42-Phaeocystis_antarctica.AAC.3
MCVNRHSTRRGRGARVETSTTRCHSPGSGPGAQSPAYSSSVLWATREPSSSKRSSRAASRICWRSTDSCGCSRRIAASTAPGSQGGYVSR